MKNNNSFNSSKRLVVKIGSSLLTNKKGGVNKSVLKNVVSDIVWLLNKNKEVIVVSSGAIALGRGQLNLKNDLTLNESQACLLYTSPSPRDVEESRMPSSA